MINLDHFGLHRTESGIPLLVQQDRVDHVLDVDMNVEARVHRARRTLKCPHKIDLAQRRSEKLPDEPLVELFLPGAAPGPGEVVFMEDTNHTQEVVRQLIRLSSPTAATSALQPLWLFKANLVHDLLQLTNLQPLVVYGFRQDMAGRLSKIIEAAAIAPRRLVVLLPALQLTARPKVMTTKLDPKGIESLPLEMIGAQHLFDVMTRG